MSLTRPAPFLLRSSVFTVSSVQGPGVRFREAFECLSEFHNSSAPGIVFGWGRKTLSRFATVMTPAALSFSGVLCFKRLADEPQMCWFTFNREILDLASSVLAFRY